MRELCVLFVHHADDEVTRKHFAQIKLYNPTDALVALTFDRGLPGACRVTPRHWEISNQHRSVDTLVYQWYLDSPIEAERYLIFEYDTLCLMPVRLLYDQVWDKPASCSITAPAAGADWCWYKDKWVQDHRAEYGDCLGGMLPICGVMLSRDALRGICAVVRRRCFYDVFCECRLGTAARMAGYEPVKIRPDIEFYIGIGEKPVPGPGIWHPVKK